MKKRIFILILMFFSAFFLISCKNSKKFEDNFSEITKIYFQGENRENNSICSICVGKREEPYRVDGIHNPVCDFSLLSLYSCEFYGDSVYVDIFVNNEKTVFELFYNPISNVYINDLGFALSEDDEIFIVFDGDAINLINKSDCFVVDYKEAIKISTELLSDKITALYKNNVFMGECYLKVLSNKTDDSIFWLFSLQTRAGETFNIVISVDTGQVVAEN